MNQANRVLIIGATGAIASAVLAAERQIHGSRVEIVAVRRNPQKHVFGVNDILRIEFDQRNVCGSDWIRELQSYGPFVRTYFCFAKSSHVGFPVELATQGQIEEALNFSFMPAVKMDERGWFGTIVVFSSFLGLPLVQRVYGAMGPAKAQLEQWAAENPERRQVFRVGGILSNSLRGIGLAAWRYYRHRGTKLDELFPDVPKRDQGFVDMLPLQLSAEEQALIGQDLLGPGRLTVPADVTAAVVGWLKRPACRAVNVVRSFVWPGEPQRLVPVA